MSLSRRESALLNAVEAHGVFSASTVRRLTGWKEDQTKNTLSALKRKGILLAIKKNAYILQEKLSEQVYEIATQVAAPSYISFWTACSLYGFTEQQVRTIQVSSTKQYPLIRGKQYAIETTTLLPKRWFGYQRLNNMVIAEPEKVLVECLYKPEKCGGVGELKNCLRKAWPTLNQAKFEAYMRRFGVKAVFARCGYLLEELAVKHHLKFVLPKGYTLLNPAKKPGERYNHTWRIISNDQ